ncbi:MAG: S8 family serine peptidase [Chloroflexota bacterium]
MLESKFSEAFTQQFSQTKKEEQITVLIRTKQRMRGRQEAELSLDQLMNEQLATKRSHLLGQVQKRYGKGAEFCQNYQESRNRTQAKVMRAAPKATNLWLADTVAVTGTRDEIEELASHEDIETIDINPTFRLPEILNTPLEDSPEIIDGSSWGLAKILAPEVWGGFGRGENVLVGHLDTGVDDTHPALTGKIAAFEEFDSAGNPLGTAPNDSGSHGTHTAGTIVGRNFRGINIGVAPEAKLLSALVLNGFGGSYAQIVAGLQWVVAKGAHVVNMSLGGLGYSTLWNLPILNATLSGSLVVASIGNSGFGTSGGPGNDLYALGVGATHYGDGPAGFSSGQTLIEVWHDVLSPFYGPLTYMKPDISAPGVQVLSSVPGSELAAFNGTSMAAPHVVGAIALLLSANPSLMGDPFAIRSILLGSIEDYGESGRDSRFGFGRLDALTSSEIGVNVN